MEGEEKPQPKPKEVKDPAKASTVWPAQTTKLLQGALARMVVPPKSVYDVTTGQRMMLPPDGSLPQFNRPPMPMQQVPPMASALGEENGDDLYGFYMSEGLGGRLRR